MPADRDRDRDARRHGVGDRHRRSGVGERGRSAPGWPVGDRERRGRRRQAAGERHADGERDALAARVAGREREPEVARPGRVRGEVAVRPRARGDRDLCITGVDRHVDAGGRAVAHVGHRQGEVRGLAGLEVRVAVAGRAASRSGAPARTSGCGVAPVYASTRSARTIPAPVRASTPAGARSSAVAVERLAHVGRREARVAGQHEPGDRRRVRRRGRGAEERREVVDRRVDAVGRRDVGLLRAPRRRSR